MATTIDAPAPPPHSMIILPDSREMPRKLWTRDDVRWMQAEGLLDSDKHYVLIEGEIIEKMGQGRRQILICMRVLKILADVFGFDYIQSQSTLALNFLNEPEPDTAVLDKPLSEYLDNEPGPENVRLMVEVSDTTLSTDRRVKSLLYSRAGIVEYWIVNIQDRKLEVYRQPSPDGYTLNVILNDQETVSPVQMPSAEIRVLDLLPKNDTITS